MVCAMYEGVGCGFMREGENIRNHGRPRVGQKKKLQRESMAMEGTTVVLSAPFELKSVG